MTTPDPACGALNIFGHPCERDPGHDGYHVTTGPSSCTWSGQPIGPDFDQFQVQPVTLQVDAETMDKIQPVPDSSASDLAEGLLIIPDSVTTLREAFEAGYLAADERWAEQHGCCPSSDQEDRDDAYAQWQQERSRP